MEEEKEEGANKEDVQDEEPEKEQPKPKGSIWCLVITKISILVKIIRLQLYRIFLILFYKSKIRRFTTSL